MSLNLNGNVTGIYLGSTKADAVYLGNVKVFEAVPPQEFVTIGGRAYPVVTIGTQKWMAENLDWKFSGLLVGKSGTSASEERANYYDNDKSTYGVNGNKYGLLYNWTAAKYLEDNKASLIPGWHLPTAEEWDALATAVGGSTGAGTKLKSTSGWNNSGNGTDEYGFSYFPTGLYNGSFTQLGNYTPAWTASDYSSGSAYVRSFNSGASMSSGTESKAYQFCIRLVKDA